MKTVRLYHKNVYLPKPLIEQVFCQQRLTDHYVFSRHLRERFNDDDKSHNHVTLKNVLKIINGLKYKKIVPFEVETVTYGGAEKVTKYVVRQKCGRYEDMSVVIRGRKVITAYVNNSNDNHPTLDKSKYVNFR